uniref:Putative secreted protein n=1 Tax=Anopheles darlingi TaxID=43151 RepID=A0A2M4DI35_ANODA
MLLVLVLKVMMGSGRLCLCLMVGLGLVGGCGRGRLLGGRMMLEQVLVVLESLVDFRLLLGRAGHRGGRGCRVHRW